ncbi:MAG: siderophore-interacting protein [Ignavibacteria bacterium]|nr:siderophore-interacting protein [Ignavibacteria bacterium]
MSITNTESKIKFLKASIISNEKIAGHTYHLKIQGEDIKNIDYTPGMHMKVVVEAADDSLQNIKLRSYSIWDFDSDKGTIDMAVCTHSSGLGSKWIEQAEPGNDFYFFIKKTLIVDNSADNYFFIGDISTLGHFYKVNRALPEDKKVFSFIYGNETDFFPDLNGEKPFDFFVHSSDKSSPAPTEFLKEKISSVFDNGQIDKDQYTIVYLGGDARICADLPPWFMKNFGFKPEQIKMKSFWNPYKVREE